jgi:uncharacterized DUF497 family protein
MVVRVIFDPAKDSKNIKDHGISLVRATDFDLDSAQIDVDDRQDYGEVRYNAIGWLDAKLNALTFTIPAPDTLRAISLRPTTKTEQRKYAQDQ